jgi:septum formation inhibitor-activating ATPase MinD
MILLITASATGRQVQEALQRAVCDVVKLAPNTAAGLRALREYEFDAVVIDQSAATEPDITVLINHIDSAIPVYTNLGLSSSARIVAEIKNAMRRRRADQASALKSANVALREELRNAVTGILLSSELALSMPALPSSAQSMLREVVHLANGMRRQLDI